MTSAFPNFIERQQAQRRERSEVARRVCTRLYVAQAAINDGVRWLEHMADAGASGDFIHDVAAGLLDEARDIRDDMEGDLDNVGLDTADAALDLAELQALLAAVSS